MIRLSILGPAELRNNHGVLEHSFLAGPKRLALLSFLVLNRTGSFQRRDKILPLFWPEKGQKSARNSLSNMLYHIRQSMGSEIIITRGTEELTINLDLVWCDAIEFKKTIADGNWKNAIDLYRGKLLDGLYIPKASSKFEQWLDLERENFHQMYSEALEQIAEEAEKNKNFNDAAKWWKTLSAENPFETRITERWVRALASAGNQNEAMRRAQEHGAFLENELGEDRADVVQKLTQNLDQYPKEYEIESSPEEKKSRDVKKSTSIAVLPFEEFGQSTDTSNFANGLHHDLLTRLSGITGLKVISRTSVLRFRKTHQSIPEIAEELGVDIIIEGGIQESGGQMRLHIQVIDTKTDGHTLAETYDRKLTKANFFDVQSDLAEKITGALQTKLTPKEKVRLAEWTPTESIEAYRFYTMGRRELDQRTKKSMQKSLDYFNQAVELDSDYALAWVGLADALTLLYDYGHESAENTLNEAESAINRALKLDPNLAEAYASLGLLYSNRHEGSEAIRALNKAVENQPSYAEAHNWLSWNYQLLGKAELALKSAKKAVELNPLSPEAVSNLSVSLLYNGLTKDALTEANRALEIQPEWATPKFYKGLALFELDQYSEAASVLQNLKSPWAGVGPMATEALCYFAMGMKEKVIDFFDHFKNNGNLFAAGLIHAAFNETGKAIEYITKINYWDDWPTLSIYHLYPEILKPVRNHERFPEIIKMVEKSRGKT
jgi:TolB-like protein